LIFRELSFNRGDVIRVHRVVDVNWLEGERNGQIGIFPSSYVQVCRCV
uniref:SH3 domain-containing protein n=1 Tax=Ascaris lumbricoides TaxID=6252 RepID=A0A0M3HJ66_ASCLU